MPYDVPLWPIPRPSARARLRRPFGTTTVTFPLGGSSLPTLDLSFQQNPQLPLAQRLAWLRRGHHVTLVVLIIGRQAWCPPSFPEGHPITLTASSAASSGGGGVGTERVVPLHELTVADMQLLDPPDRAVIPGLETWTLTTIQDTGEATITGLLQDLALLAAVAGWAPPEPLLSHRHAGARSQHV